jgi:hypothetical protein
MTHLSPVRVFFNRYDAEQAKGLLDEQSIPCFISADDGGGFYPSLTLSNGNIRLLVNDRDLARAHEALRVLGDE